mmetsp:Transcript_17838/g.30768  ORF Transcript_17838/g.30768 Transcript_17838/m.30768 type:complete len:216 (+) Transcript_17838:268-915(+)
MQYAQHHSQHGRRRRRRTRRNGNRNRRGNGRRLLLLRNHRRRLRRRRRSTRQGHHLLQTQPQPPSHVRHVPSRIVHETRHRRHDEIRGELPGEFRTRRSRGESDQGSDPSSADGGWDGERGDSREAEGCNLLRHGKNHQLPPRRGRNGPRPPTRRHRSPTHAPSRHLSRFRPARNNPQRSGTTPRRMSGHAQRREINTGIKSQEFGSVGQLWREV